MRYVCIVSVCVGRTAVLYRASSCVVVLCRVSLLPVLLSQILKASIIAAA